MKTILSVLIALSGLAGVAIPTSAFAAERWQEATFPPPNGGLLVFAILSDGNPACASYDGRVCLWGQSTRNIEFARVRPLACGAAHRRLYGVTGFENPNHWCNLALQGRPTQAVQAPPPATAGGYRLTGWSGWDRADGVEYRYRVGWDPANSGSSKTVEAIYEVRNPGAHRWVGSARSIDCAGKLWDSKPVELAPRETREVRGVRAPNCGNATNPQIRPNVVRSSTY